MTTSDPRVPIVVTTIVVTDTDSQKVHIEVSAAKGLEATNVVALNGFHAGNKPPIFDEYPDDVIKKEFVDPFWKGFLASFEKQITKLSTVFADRLKDVSDNMVPPLLGTTLGYVVEKETIEDVEGPKQVLKKKKGMKRGMAILEGIDMVVITMDVKLSWPTPNTKKHEIEQFGDVDFNDESAPQRNDLGGRSAEEALGSQPTEGDAMNKYNVEAPPMSEEPQTQVSPKEITTPINDTYPPDRRACLCVHHHAPTWHLEKEPAIVRDLAMLAGLDRISEISYEHCNAGLISAICEHWQPETNMFHLSWGEMSLSLDDVQHLIGLSVDGDVPITEGSWSLPKLVEIFKKNLYQDEDFFNSMKTGGQGNYLSLEKLVNFYAGKLEKYNNIIQNERPVGHKKKAMSALYVSWIFSHFPKLPGIPKEQHSDATEYCTRWKWGLSITDRTSTRKLMKYREAFDNYKVEDVVWDPYKAERRSDHDFSDNTFFNGHTSSPCHVEPIYPNRVVRQFARIQPIPKIPKCVKVSGLRTWDGDEPKQYKSKYDWVDATECKQLRVRIKQMKLDIILNDVVHEQYVKSFEKLPAKLEEKTKECQVLNVENTKLVQDMRIKTGVDASNVSLAIELAKQRRECKLLQDINAKLVEQSERQHPEPVPLPSIIVQEAWCQAMKKEFHSGELAEKDNPTFIKIFDQYIRFYTIAQQGPKDVRGVQGEDGNSSFRVRQQLNIKVKTNLRSSRGEMVYEQLRRACAYGGKHVEYRHMGHLLATCYEKVVVFISNHEAYTFLPLFWLRKNNHISNEKRFENLVGDTTKFW
ncbi:hypothetical protein GIB67_017192 [Kingdonia uniflora]|uniref:Aminotransferase-like plant mobile domain-containing protein n=1 Tax=Kingdonia uniflora TaxID=39325 RepID=A0A7J7NKI9_9MAGN|nr:hypothetical protein GIB67_017192 [Kingdonia uniflora]